MESRRTSSVRPNSRGVARPCASTSRRCRRTCSTCSVFSRCWGGRLRRKKTGRGWTSLCSATVSGRRGSGATDRSSAERSRSIADRTPWSASCRLGSTFRSAAVVSTGHPPPPGCPWVSPRGSCRGAATSSITAWSADSRRGRRSTRRAPSSTSWPHASTSATRRSCGTHGSRSRSWPCRCARSHRVRCSGRCYSSSGRWAWFCS